MEMIDGMHSLTQSQIFHVILFLLKIWKLYFEKSLGLMMCKYIHVFIGDEILCMSKEYDLLTTVPFECCVRTIRCEK